MLSYNKAAGFYLQTLLEGSELGTDEGEEIWGELEPTIGSNPSAIKLIEAYERTNLGTTEEIEELCDNKHPDAAELINEALAYKPTAIKWSGLCASPAAEHIIRGLWSFNFPRLKKKYMLENSAIMDIVEQLLEEDGIDTRWFSRNEHDRALDILDQQPELINWLELSYNDNPRALKLILANADEPDIHWHMVSANPLARAFLLENPHKIDWSGVSGNTAMVDVALNNFDRISWYRFIVNPAAIDWLEAHPGYCEESIWRNPAIFTYNFELIKAERAELNEAIIAAVYHPDRLEKFKYEFESLE